MGPNTASLSKGGGGGRGQEQLPSSPRAVTTWELRNPVFSEVTLGDLFSGANQIRRLVDLLQVDWTS